MPRKLNKKLNEEILERLEKNQVALNILKSKDKKKARELLIHVASSLVGIKESQVNNTGEIVDLIQLISGGKTDAWCMKFVQSCIAFVEHHLSVTSPIYFSGSCWRVWEKTAIDQRVKNYPNAGAIIIWQDGDGLKQGSGGHTGFVVSFSKSENRMITIEGNTSDVNFRSGDGVYKKQRVTTKHDHAFTKKQKIVGYLKPF
jgi:hypothetical protein